MLERLRKRRPPRQQGGFTLIEILVALVVLLIGLTGILSMQTTALRATSFSRHANEASALAEDMVEYLRTMPQSTVASGTDPNNPVDPQGNGGGIFTRSWTVTNTTLASGDEYLTLQVTVEWNETNNPSARPYNVTVATQRPVESP